MLNGFGAVLPIDAITGLPIGVPWVADRNTPTPQRSYTLAEFPIQAGYGIVTDAILRASPPVVSVVFELSDIAPLLHPLPSFRGRSYKLAQDFELIENRLGPCRVWVYGYPPLVNYGIADVSPVKVQGARAITLNVTFRKLSYTTLMGVPAAVSPDLLASGILPV